MKLTQSHTPQESSFMPAVHGDVVFASCHDADQTLEISRRSLSRALNGICDGIVVLRLDAGGHEYCRQFIPVDIVQDYVLGRFADTTQYQLSADVLKDARCRQQ